MKKKNFTHNGLTLNKKVISSLASDAVKGGATNSCFLFANTGCAKTVGCNYTVGCPPSNACPTQIGCGTGTTGNTSVISASCPQNGDC